MSTSRKNRNIDLKNTVGHLKVKRDMYNVRKYWSKEKKRWNGVYWQNTGNCRGGHNLPWAFGGLLPREILYRYCLSAWEVIWATFNVHNRVVELFLQWMDFGVFCKLVCTCKTKYMSVMYIRMRHTTPCYYNHTLSTPERILSFSSWSLARILATPLCLHKSFSPLHSKSCGQFCKQKNG